MNKRYEVQYEVTNKCLLDCKHCSSYSMRKLKQKNFGEKELVKFLKLLEGDTHLYLTGGEPLLDNELIIKIENVKKSIPNINIGLFTSGVISSNDNLKAISLELSHSLKKVGIDDCYLSIYHIDESLHDFITNRPLALKYTMETIQNLCAANIKVKIHLVVTKYNVNDLAFIINNLIKLGVTEVRLLRLVPSGSAILNWEDIGVPIDVLFMAN